MDCIEWQSLQKQAGELWVIQTNSDLPHLIYIGLNLGRRRKPAIIHDT